MDTCRNCHAELGIGRFCTNCGMPVGGASPTDETMIVLPPVPPPPPPQPEPAPPGHRGRIVALVLGILLLAVVAVAGAWLAGRASDDPVSSPSDPEPGGPAADVTSQLAIDAPAPVRPGVNLAGEPVHYDPENMIDGELTTAYRLPGDASGTTLTFTLPGELAVREVGLVNGYAKTDSHDGTSANWYLANRAITRVTWLFDDGSEVVQELGRGTHLQRIRVDRLRTTTLRLRIEATEPGRGPRVRNTTAISEVLVRAG